MGIGTGIFLLVVGAVLVFGVEGDIAGLDLVAIGWICVAAGALAIILSLVLMQNRRRSSHTVVQERYDAGRPAAPPAGPGETVVREERRDPGI